LPADVPAELRHAIEQDGVPGKVRHQAQKGRRNEYE
jgi:hypothetical protein